MLTRLSTPPIDAAVADIVQTAEDACGFRLPDLHHHGGAEWVARIVVAVSGKVRSLIESLSEADEYIQVSPNLRIHLPGDTTAIPFHSDTLYGHSAYETNYWLTLTPAHGSSSLWMCDPSKTDMLRDTLAGGASLTEFEDMARFHASPIVADKPGLYTFCCSDFHGSLPNTTDQTRVSFDMRTIGPDDPQGVKRRGSYFRPRWLKPTPCPLPRDSGIAMVVPVTTVASLDVGTPVYLQRQAMRSFYPQPAHRELVEFVGLSGSAPTLEDAMKRGPVIIYSIRQFRRAPKIEHPIGIVDEKIWVQPGDETILRRLWRECA